MIIPAFKPTLDYSLTVPHKSSKIKDLSKSYLSSLLMLSLLLAYQSSDRDTQDVFQVKGHDVCSMAASLALI